VQHEADIGFDRPAGIDRDLAAGAIGFLSELLQQLRQRLVLDRPVDDKAEGAAAVMLHDQDDRVIEARIVHPRRRDQELARPHGRLIASAVGGYRRRDPSDGHERRQARNCRADRPHAFLASPC